jgi:type VI secretion system protein ImpH
MDSEKRPALCPVTQALTNTPYEFDFFQAVRWLENQRRHLPRVGWAHRPQDDAVRFHQHVTLGFPPAAVHSCREDTEGSKPLLNMWISFFGLLGSSGPMPLAITEYVYNRLHAHGDRTLAAFLDIFNHRMSALFYRAWACCQQTVSHDRPDDDWFCDYLGSFLGIGTPSFRGRDALPDGMKLYYAGHLSCQTRHAEGLEAILGQQLGLPVVLVEFIGQWISLLQKDRSRLGEPAANAKLGETLIVGSSSWESQQKFRIRIGPMTFREYKALLPGGDGFLRLAAWVWLYVGEELEWEAQLILTKLEVPPVCLARQGHLGWSCWLCTRCPQEDREDLVLMPPRR